MRKISPDRHCEGEAIVTLGDGFINLVFTEIESYNRKRTYKNLKISGPYITTTDGETRTSASIPPSPLNSSGMTMEFEKKEVTLTSTHLGEYHGSGIYPLSMGCRKSD